MDLCLKCPLESHGHEVHDKSSSDCRRHNGSFIAMIRACATRVLTWNRNVDSDSEVCLERHGIP